MPEDVAAAVVVPDVALCHEPRYKLAYTSGMLNMIVWYSSQRMDTTRPKLLARMSKLMGALHTYKQAFTDDATGWAKCQSQ